MNITKTILLGGILLVLGACMPQRMPTQQFLGFNFTKNVRKITIPFNFVNNLVILPLFINNSDTLHFIMDTGVKIALVTELQAQEAFDVKDARPQKVKGLGNGVDLDALLAVNNTFRMPYLYGERQDLLILLEDVFFLSTRLNTKVNGLLGYDLFKNFPVEIDYPRRTLILHNPQKRLNTNGFQSFDLSIEGGKPYIKVKIAIEKNKLIPVKLLIDTGASHSLSLEVNDEKGIILPQKTAYAYLGKGLNGDLEGRIGRISQFNIGKYTFHDIPAAFPDTASMSGFYGIAGRNGSLGANIMKRFRVIFDYPNGKLYLRPNSYFDKPFYPNLSGLEFSSPMPGLRYYVISQVTPNMPAAQAGLQAGDELMMLNGQNASSYEINEINEIMHSRPGRKINLKVKRGEKNHKISFQLADPTDIEQ